MIYAISDLHGNLPPIPKCDILLVGGDVSPLWLDDDHGLMLMWLDTNFRLWLEETRQNVEHIVGIAGNHDFIFEAAPELVSDLNLPWLYLQDSTIEIDGIKVYGLPWVPNLPYFAFHGTDLMLVEKYGQVPEGTNVLLSHGPPRGYGDGGHPEWCTAAANATIEVRQPQAYVCGHIHEGFGTRVYEGDRTTVYNVSFVDEHYRAQDRIVRISV